MEDFASKITELLNNPDVMRQIRDLAGKGSEGSALKEENTEKIKEENEKLKIKNQNVTEGGIPSLNDISPDMLSTVMKLAPLISSMNNDDKYAKFLHSLRPLLSESRQRKLDESSKFIKLIKIFPILKNNGII